MNPHDGSHLPSYGTIVKYAMTATTFNLLEAAGARHSRGELVVCGGLYRALWIQGAGIVADRASVPADHGPGVRLLPREAGRRGGRAGAAAHADDSVNSPVVHATSQVAKR